MPDNGTYLLTNIGFSLDEKPILLLQTRDGFTDMYPLGHTFTLSFDMAQRFCIGWRDITTGERFVCPDGQQVNVKYEQCTACQKRTGFNPAFYHGSSVSPQQEARNTEPHILYLAHFGSGVIKVGISHAKRGHARLIEQGARSALILEALPSAHIARQYEKQIATLPGFSETIQLRKKAELLTKPYDTVAAAAELRAARVIIESTLSIRFDKAELLDFSSVYFPNQPVDLALAHSTAKDHLISGTCIGQLGSMLFCEQSDSILYLPLKKYIGYNVTVSDTATSISVPAQQTTLF